MKTNFKDQNKKRDKSLFLILSQILSPSKSIIEAQLFFNIIKSIMLN